MRKAFLVVILLGLVVFVRQRQVAAYTITSPDTRVSATVVGTVLTPTPTTSTTPTPTPSVSVTPTPSPSVSPTPTPPIGGRFSLFGYTSPQAKVSITNPGLYIDTTADNTGYFEFVEFLRQTIIEDICLMAQDQLGRVTMPVCIPPIPDNENQSIGPVIMPPTVSLNSDSFFSGDTILLTGQTTPHSEINLSLFSDQSRTGYMAVNGETDFLKRTFFTLLYAGDMLNPIRPSYALTLPKKQAKTDANGEFSLKLPSDESQFYRTFAQTVYKKDYSLKSVTLNFNVLPGWFTLMKGLIGFLNGLRYRIAEIIIMGQVLVIFALLMRHYLRPHVIARMRALAIMEHPLPIFTSHELLLQEHELALKTLIEEEKLLHRDD